MTEKKILFLVNAPTFFLSHRLPLAVAAKAAGYAVHVATADDSGRELIEKQGFVFHPIPFARSGQNPLYEIGTFIRLLYVFRRVRPDLVHAITIKPVIYGGIAARLTRIRSFVAAVSGLGTVFLAKSTAARLRRQVVIGLYRAAFNRRALAVIFQNPDDRDKFLDFGLLSPQAVRMIRGSGVRLADYPYVSEHNGRPAVAMAARLLKDKGVVEFVEAARLLRQRGVNVDMRLIGAPDLNNPTSIGGKDIDRWVAGGYVNYLGYREDIAEQYSLANIICLPSYREGLPKSLIEAAACGRAVVTTDVPGCRDAIIPDVTGLLVPPCDADALADAIQKLVDNPQMRYEMGKAGRRLAEMAFNIELIVDQHMLIYKELLEDG